MIDSEPDPSLSPDPDPAFYWNPFLSENKVKWSRSSGVYFFKKHEQKR